MAAIVVVQCIVVKWTKESRGGEMATLRNAVPETAKVPVQRLNLAGVVLLEQRITYGEYHRFTIPDEKIILHTVTQPLASGCIKVESTQTTVQMTFQYHRYTGGAPSREWIRKTLTLRTGEWGQMLSNGRFSDWDNGQWRYEKHVVNVGIFERVTPSVFTGREPDYRFDAMATLI